MHKAIKKAGKAILWVVFILFCVSIIVGFLGLSGCVTQEVVIDGPPVCVNSTAKIILGKITCVASE